MLIKDLLYLVRMKRLFLCCICAINAYSILQSQDKGVAWQSHIDSLVAHHGMKGMLIHVEAPLQNITWTGAGGVAEISSLRPLTVHEPLRIASITKSFVATTILRLWEDEKLRLDDPVVNYISPQHAEILRTDGYEPEKITIRHLLSHTSGMYDHGSSTEYVDAIFTKPEYQWTRTEQIRRMVEWGKPVGAPGERFSYSDTGYLLLGETIEKITGKPLGIALRQWINYTELEMHDTWFEITEEKPAQTMDRIHQYLGTTDTYDLHPSFDLYGGGGIVTTVEDLTDFYTGLFHRQVFHQSATLDTMIAPVARRSTAPPKLDYRMGIWRMQVNGLDVWTHSGFWGVKVWYLPALDACIAMAVIRQEDFDWTEDLLQKVIADLQDRK